MRTPRIFTEQPLTGGQQVQLEEAAARHLIQVLRLKQGSPLILFNGDGHDYPAQLNIGGRREAGALLGIAGEAEAEQPLSIHLGLGISKGERMDIAIQKAVELGVQAITPLISERCVVRISDQRMLNRLEHWQRVIIAACEQSGRRRLPHLNPSQPLTQWVAGRDEERCLLFDHRSSETLATLPPPKAGVALLVGPEGGLAPEERSLALQQGFIGIRLGPRILRTETAPLAAIAAMQVLWGDFR